MSLPLVRHQFSKFCDSERICHAKLWTQEIETGVRISLSGVREMLIEQTGIQFPSVVYFVRHSGRSQNVEREILALRAGDVRVAIN